jgi:membrane associated rhomboid family serine protease
MISELAKTTQEKCEKLLQIPLFTKFVILLSIILYACSWIPYYPIYLVAALPRTLFLDHSISQLFAFPYQHLGFAHLVFALIAYVPLAIADENKQGTIRFSLKFGILNFLISLIHSLVLFCFGLIFSRYYTFCIYYPCAGLWPLTMVLMIEKFSDTPDAETDFLCLPFTIKAKFYPACFLVFWYFVFGYIFELMVGAMVGYLSKK